MAMETRIADYLDFLGELGAANAPYFLEGGQAVNFWAEYFSNKGAGAAIERYRPFTSKDCDLWVSFAALRHIESNARGGTLIKGETASRHLPNCGSFRVAAEISNREICLDRKIPAKGLQASCLTVGTQRMSMRSSREGSLSDLVNHSPQNIDLASSDQ